MSEEKIFKINLSVKFKKNGSARRFIVRADDFQGLFSAFSAEMANAAPNSSIFWIDGDGDNVIITSVAEFEEAYIQSGFPNNNLLVVTTEDKPVESAAPQQPQLLQQQHVYTGASHNALCDLCDVRITGTRFRCLICNDFDLCCNCESIGAHAEHAMLRIVDPITTYVPWGAKINQTVNGIIDAATKNTANVHQFDDFRTKSVQIMNDVGSLISTTLSNFGIEADYDVYDRGCRRTNPTSTNAASASSSGEKKEENKKEENKMKTPKNNAGKTEAMKGIIAGLQKLSKVPEGFNELPTTTVPATAETENVNIMKKYENTFKKVDAAGARITALKKFDESLESLAALGREKELRDQAKNQGFNAAKKQGAVAVPGLFSAKQRKGETDNSTKFSTGGFHAVKETMPVGKGLFSRHKVDGQKNRAHQNTTRRLGYHSDDSIERSPSPPRLGSGFQKSKNAFGQKPCTFGTSSKATAPPAHMGFGTAKNTGCYRSDNAKACSFHSQKTSGFGGFERKPIFGGFGAGARSTPFSSRGFESNSGFGGSTGFGGNAFESAPVYGGFPPRGGFGERSGFGGDSGFGGCKRSGYGGGSVFGGASGFGGFKREGFGDAPFGQPSGMKYDPYEDLLDEDHPDHVYEPSDFNDESVLAPKRLSKEKKLAKKAEKAAAKAEKAAAKQAAMEASVKATEAVEIVEKQENTVAAKTSLALASCEVALDQKKDSVAEIKKPNILEKVAVNLEAPIENTVTTVVPFVQKEEVCDAALPVQTKTDEDAQSIGSEVEHLDDVDSDGWVDAKSTMPSAPEIENPIEAANETIETVLSPVPSTSQQAVYPQLSRDDVMAGSQARQETYGELLLMGYVEVDSRRAIAHCGADLGKCVDYIAGYLN